MQKREQVAILGVTFTRAPITEPSTKIDNIKWDENKVRKDKPFEKKANYTTILSQKVPHTSIQR